MYIRKTTTGKRGHTTYRLVRSERTKGRDHPVQRTLLNLGAHFNFPPDTWKPLCQRIDSLLSGQDDLLTELPPELAAEADRIFKLLVASQSAAAGNGEEPDHQLVDLNSVKSLHARTAGVEHAGLWAADLLGLPALLDSLGLAGSRRDAALASIIGRMAAPGSEAATATWLRQRSALDELMGTDFSRIPDQRLHRAAKSLLAHREAIEEHLFGRARDLFGLDATVVLYDLTNTYLEGMAGGNPSARRGHSKEKRSDCRLLTLGLALDGGSGLVRRSRLFAGNVAESGTLAEMLEGLGAPPGALVVMDAGVGTEAQCAWLREHGYRYLSVSRQWHREFDPGAATHIDTASGHRVGLHRVADEARGEVRLYCHSERRQAKEVAMVEKKRAALEQALDNLDAGLRRPRTTKAIDKIHERIGRLRESYRLVARHYQIDIDTDKSGKRATAVRYRTVPLPNSMITHPGVYCLRSTETHLASEDLWRSYIMLTDVESVFRSLKSELGLRPVHHQTEAGSDGHLFISVLAYQLVQVIRRRLREQGMAAGWKNLRDSLNGHMRVTTSFKRKGGGRTLVRNAVEPDEGQAAIYEALGIDSKPGGMSKTITKGDNTD